MPCSAISVRTRSSRSRYVAALTGSVCHGPSRADLQSAVMSSGLTSFSLHAFDQSSAEAIGKLKAERPKAPGFSFAGATTGEVDPETVAKRYLAQALASSAVPSFSTPDTTAPTEFRSLGTETVPLTGTRFVKFRQTVGKVPLYGSLVTVELDEDNNLVSLNSSIGEPQGVDPVAKVAPSRAVEVVAARPGTRKLEGVVPSLHYYYDDKGSRWRLVYILENVPIVAEPRSRKTGDHEPPHFMDYVVDAHTAKLVAELPRTPSVARGMNRAVDGLGTMRSFRVGKADDGWVLSDAKLNVHTFHFAFGDPVVDAGELPGTAIGRPPRWTPAAVSAHANAVSRGGVPARGAVPQRHRQQGRTDHLDDRLRRLR